MDDESLRLKVFLERLGNTYLMCDERGIRNCVYAPTMSGSGLRFPSGLLYGDSDDSDDSDDDESDVVSENEAEGVAESEDSQGNATEDLGNDRQVEEAEGDEIMSEGADGDWEDEAAGPEGAENFDGTGERSGAGGDDDDDEDDMPPMNPFQSYRQFDGTYLSKSGTSSFRVFLSMLPPSEQGSPLRVSVVKYATFSDLIGLTLLKYTSENPNWTARLKEDVNEYGLCIAGETGEIGSEPYVLDSEETIGDFTRINLAVVESPGKEMELRESEEEDALTHAGGGDGLSDSDYDPDRYSRE